TSGTPRSIARFSFRPRTSALRSAGYQKPKSIPWSALLKSEDGVSVVAGEESLIKAATQEVVRRGYYGVRPSRKSGSTPLFGFSLVYCAGSPTRVCHNDPAREQESRGAASRAASAFLQLRETRKTHRLR